MCTLLTAIFPGDRPACVNSKGLIVNDEPAAALLTSAFKQMDLIVLVEDISDSTVSVQLTAPSMREVFVVDFPHERKPRSCNAEATKP
jgi:hypothetical protein